MSINSENTKAEILAAYRKLEKQNQELKLKRSPQAAIDWVTATPVTASTDATTLESDRDREQDLSQTIQSLETVRDGFGGAVSNLSA